MAKPTRPETHSPRPAACYQHELGIRAAANRRPALLLRLDVLWERHVPYGGTIRHDRCRLELHKPGRQLSFRGGSDLEWLSSVRQP